MSESEHQYVKDGREIAVARLIGLVTSDGLLEFYETVPIGSKYVIYRDPIRMEVLHVPSQTVWSRDMYECVDGGWLPCELLEIVK